MRYFMKTFSFSVCLVLFCSCLAVPCPAKKHDGKRTATDDTEFESTWALLKQVADEVMNQHISPPTRQQMFLGATKGIFLSSRMAIPREASRELSRVSSTDEFKDLLKKYWGQASRQKVFDAEQTQRLAIQALLDSATTGMQYVSAKEFRVRNRRPGDLFDELVHV